MNKINLTIKNYRCFNDTNPVSISIDNGIISFVGPNNSGKSSLLKMLREFRPVWQHLSAPERIIAIIQRNAFNSGLECVNDPLEIFTDSNNRPFEMTIEVINSMTTPSQNQIYCNKLIITSARNNIYNWETKCYSPQSGNLEHLQNQVATINGIDQVHIAGITLTFATADLVNAFATLSKAVYIGPFRNAINAGATSYYDIQIGEGFINTWNDWKTGASRTNNLAISKLTEDIRHIFGFSSLEITAATQLKTLQININNKPYKLTEVGSGLAQFIVVFGSVLINAPDILLIDEPELNLHPSLQIDFITTLAKYAKEATIMATHSIGLARSVSDEHIYSFQKKDHHTVVTHFEKTMNYSEFLGEMSFSAYREMGFDKILLVEGTTDVKTMQQFLRKRNKDHKIVVLPLGGDSLTTGNTEHELAELTRISNNIAALVDSERTTQDGAPAPKRQGFSDLCKKLKFNVHLTDRRATENYFTDSAIKTVKGDKYCAIGNFQRLEDAQHGWKKAENWRIASEMSWEDIAETDLGKFIEGL